jgi:hypothetical protein
MRLRSKLLAVATSGVVLLGLAGAAVTAGNAYADPGDGSGVPRRIIRLENFSLSIANLCIDNNTQGSTWHCTGNVPNPGGGDVDFPYNPGDSITFAALVVAGNRLAIDVPEGATQCQIKTRGFYLDPSCG